MNNKIQLECTNVEATDVHVGCTKGHPKLRTEEARERQ